ncbi:MAG: PAS domain-containing protein [Alphaproteobacteria bacterium]|nr:PAS domain-containing protein [Alphaproteobacteria bacterium]
MSQSFFESLGDPLLRAMYEYWRGKAAGRSMPRRRDIDPSEIPKLLPHLMITEVLDGGRRFRYRLSGTAVTEAFGRSLTGQYVDEVMKGPYRDFIERLYRNVHQGRRCIFCESRYTGSKSLGVTTKRLFMPLSEDEAFVNQVLVIQTFHYASHDRSIVIVDNMDAFVGANIELAEDDAKS